MRTILILWAALAGVAAAAPGPPLHRTDGKAQADAARFAYRMVQVIDQVGEQYYRPVAAEKLYLAAASSLYQAARRRVPASLPERVRTALAKERKPGAPDDDPRNKLLAAACEEASAHGTFDPILAACKAVAKELDPYSGLVTAEEQRKAVGLDYESLGVGLELRPTTVPGPIDVEAVAFGGPAQRAGMRPGDRITRVNGVAAEKATPELLVALSNERVRLAPALIGSDDPPPPDTPRVLRLRYRRGSETEERSALLYREQFRAETVLGVARNAGNGWSFLLDERSRIAHVRVLSLSRGTAEELRAALGRIKDQKARGLVFDLRWCPGGYLNEAVDVADLFLGEQTIATVKMRGRDDTVHRGNGKATLPDLPMVALVNADTSGGAELIAAALQDHGRAEVVGQRTRGKASVQTPLSVGLDGVGFKVTSGTFLRPSGKNLHRSPDSQPRDDWGVRPKEDCRVSPELSRRFQESWVLWSLRPSSSMERLALDEPGYDTQRAAAIRVVGRMIAQTRK